MSTTWSPHAGAPFVTNDPIAVEHNDAWHEGTVVNIAPILGITHFGLRWMLTVRLENGTTLLARCDDDGRNHTYREQVAGSLRVSA